MKDSVEERHDGCLLEAIQATRAVMVSIVFDSPNGSQTRFSRLDSSAAEEKEKMSSFTRRRLPNSTITLAYTGQRCHCRSR